MATQVPPTTALRWIEVLEARRLVTRRTDPADRRRACISLTEKAAATMIAVLSEAQRIVSREPRMPQRVGDRLERS